jgi:hypothetical protein
MPKRSGKAAENEMKRHRWNRWRLLIRTPKFQKEVNRLRADYQEWRKGPPLHLGDTLIGRTTITPQKRGYGFLEEPVLCAWTYIEYDWGIVLPKRALKASFPNLNLNTIQAWERLGHQDSHVVPPALWIDSPPAYLENRSQFLVVGIDLSYPHDVSMSLLDRTLKQQRPAYVGTRYTNGESSRRRRNTFTKLTHQIQMYDMQRTGKTVKEIAQSMRVPIGTVKTSLTRVKRLLGMPKRRTWEERHVEYCLDLCAKKHKISPKCPEVQKHRRGPDVLDLLYGRLG